MPHQHNCYFHEHSTITHFCTRVQCTLPMCDKCLPIHMQQHMLNHQNQGIITFQQAYQNAVMSLKKVINQQNSNKIGMYHKLEQVKKRIFVILEQYFAGIKNSIQQKFANTTQIQKKLTKIQKGSLKTLIYHYTQQTTPTNTQQLTKLLKKSQSLEISIKNCLSGKQQTQIQTIFKTKQQVQIIPKNNLVYQNMGMAVNQQNKVSKQQRVLRQHSSSIDLIGRQRGHSYDNIVGNNKIDSRRSNANMTMKTQTNVNTITNNNYNKVNQLNYNYQHNGRVKTQLKHQISVKNLQAFNQVQDNYNLKYQNNQNYSKSIGKNKVSNQQNRQMDIQRIRKRESQRQRQKEREKQIQLEYERTQERLRQKQNQRLMQIEKAKQKQKQTQREKQRERQRQRQRQRERERERERERDRQKEWERERERERLQRQQISKTTTNQADYYQNKRQQTANLNYNYRANQRDYENTPYQRLQNDTQTSYKNYNHKSTTQIHKFQNFQHRKPLQISDLNYEAKYMAYGKALHQLKQDQQKQMNLNLNKQVLSPDQIRRMLQKRISQRSRLISKNKSMTTLKKQEQNQIKSYNRSKQILQYNNIPFESQRWDTKDSIINQIYQDRN